MKNYIAIITVFITMTSCVEVLFEQAQPIGAKELKEFPKSLQGMYIESTDNDTLVISQYEIQGDRANEEKDSTMIISSNFVLKKYKGHYVVSRKHESGLWEVGFIKPQKDNELHIFTLDGDDKDKMELLKQMVEVETKYDEEGKVGQYILNPTKKELLKILKADVFEKLGEFKKIK